MASRSISDVAGQIGKDWYMVGVHLGYSHSQLDHLEEIYQSRPLQRNHVMLSKWKQQVEKEGLDCKLVLAAHLQESGNRALAENLAPNIATENMNIRIHEENIMVKLDNAIKEINFDVKSMAASDEDIALVSQESRCIKIYHFKKRTVSMVTSECKRIAAPFDAVYSKDKDQVTGLYFTETDEKKKGVKIVYRKKSKLKLVDFTNRVEDPTGISANDQNIFVCDKTRQSIFVFKKDGEMILSISKRNSRFDLPLYIFADGNDRLFISDSKGNSVQELSGIDYGCQVIKQFRHSDFQLKEKMVPGKCCVNNDIFIPDRKSRKLLNCRTKEDISLTETPVAVTMLNPSEIVVATYEGKILSIKL